MYLVTSCIYLIFFLELKFFSFSEDPHEKHLRVMRPPCKVDEGGDLMNDDDDDDDDRDSAQTK